MVVNPYAMSACALFIMGMTTRRREACGATGYTSTGRGAGADQSPNTRAAVAAARLASTSPTTTTDSSDGANLAACSAIRRSRVSRSMTSGLPLAGMPYGCGGGYSSPISASTARTPGLS